VNLHATGSSTGAAPQNLKIDALFEVDVDDVRRHNQQITGSSGEKKKKKAIVQKETKATALVLSEMQVRHQCMGVRLMSYASKIFSTLQIDVSAAQPVIPQPIYAFAICMWTPPDGSLFKRMCLSSSQLDGIGEADLSSKNFTEQGYVNVFLGKRLGYGTKKEDITYDREALKTKVVRRFRVNDATFDDLTPEEKKVYLWFEFIAFGHLMTPGDVDASLACLNGSVDDDADKAVFKNAYEIIKLDRVRPAGVRRMSLHGDDLFGDLFREVKVIADQEKDVFIKRIASLERELSDAQKRIAENEAKNAEKQATASSDASEEPE
jgi:hypothetical protein